MSEARRPGPVVPTCPRWHARRSGRTQATRKRSAAPSCSRADVIKGWNQIAIGTPLVPFDSDFDVEAGTRSFPGPSRIPTRACRTAGPNTTVEGNPGAPVAGLPDCARAQDGRTTIAPTWSFENLKAARHPGPRALRRPGLHRRRGEPAPEAAGVQDGRGPPRFVCVRGAGRPDPEPREPRADNARNIWDGYDWSEKLGCTQAEDTAWTGPARTRRTGRRSRSRTPTTSAW